MPDTSDIPDFAKLEQLVAKIQRELAPRAEVLHNQRLPGKKSGRSRQIGILVRDKVGQYEILIVIDCKDYNKPADVKSVEEFHGLVDDVGAQKGVLVCPRGFSEAAKTRADGLQIALYSPVDTDPHKWTVNPSVPTLCDFRSAAISFGITVTSPGPFTMPYDFQFANSIRNADEQEIGSMFDVAIRQWNDGDLPSDPSEYHELRIFGESPRMDNGHGTITPVDLYIHLWVQQRKFFGYMPITRISGFKDEIRGGVITNAFQMGILEPREIAETWKAVESVEDCDPSPVIRIQGLIGWDHEHPEHNSLSFWKSQQP